MKRKITSFLLFLGLSHAVFSQMPHIDFSTNFNNSAWIPSGILFENNRPCTGLKPDSYYHNISYLCSTFFGTDLALTAS